MRKRVRMGKKSIQRWRRWRILKVVSIAVEESWMSRTAQTKGEVDLLGCSLRQSSTWNFSSISLLEIFVVRIQPEPFCPWSFDCFNEFFVYFFFFFLVDVLPAALKALNEKSGEVKFSFSWQCCVFFFPLHHSKILNPFWNISKWENIFFSFFLLNISYAHFC